MADSISTNSTNRLFSSLSARLTCQHVTSILRTPHGSIRPFGCQRLHSFTGINPHSSVRTNPPDFAIVPGLFVFRNRSTTALLPYNRQQGGEAITSTIPMRRVHGDFHRLNLGHPHASHHAGMAPFPSR